MNARQFGIGLSLLCLLYLTIQLLYVQRTEFNPDEAQGAYAAWRVLENLPYRDFKPYKTVLGYYWQSLVFHWANDTWHGYQLLRLQAVLTNTLCLGLAGVLFGRLYRRDAVLIALLALITMSNFLERSFEIRVDLLTAFAGLFSLYFLLSGKYLLAGLLCAFSFFISQKGAYYIIASNFALLSMLLVERNRERFLNGISFNLGCLAVTSVYFGTWFILAPDGSTSKATLGSHNAIVFTELYDNLNQYWRQSLQRNPAFYLIAVAHIGQLLYLTWGGRTTGRDTTLAVYALVIGCLGVWHKQPWPYFFLILVPTAFVLHASFYDWLLARLNRAKHVIVILLIICAVTPLHRLDTVLKRKNYLQHEMAMIAKRILGPGDSYVDGMDFLYDLEQAASGTRWLDKRALERMHAGGDKYHQLLIANLEKSRAKLIIRNWRLVQLPTSIQNYFALNFLHLWGNIHVYAPTIPAGGHQTMLKFTGQYEVVSSERLRIEIDGRNVWTGDVIELQAGSVSTRAPDAFRLSLHSANWTKGADPRSRFESARFMTFRYFE